MEQKTFIPKPPEYKKAAMTQERRKQVVWMIWVPLILFILLIIAASVMVCMPNISGVNTSALGSVSFIWVSAPAIPILLIVAGILIGMIYFLAKFIGLLLPFFHKVQFYFDFASKKTKEFADKAAAPVITTKGFQASTTELTKITRKGTDTQE